MFLLGITTNISDTNIIVNEHVYVHVLDLFNNILNTFLLINILASDGLSLEHLIHLAMLLYKHWKAYHWNT